MNSYTKNVDVALLIRIFLLILFGNSYAHAQLAASNVCPATTVDLTTHVSGNTSSGTLITWHTGTPATQANLVANPSQVGAGVYYAAYYDVAASCYGNTTAALTVTINACAPIINICPATTVNLTTHVSGTVASGTLVTWHTSATATQANRVADPTQVTGGLYYAAYFDVATSCYGNTTGPVAVSIVLCPTPNPDNGSVLAGTGGTAVGNVTTNDNMSGQSVVLGTGGNAIIAPVGTYPAGIDLNTTTGAVTVAASTAPGTYTLAYQLCNVYSPPSCATTTVTVTVNANGTTTPDAGTVSSGTGGTAIANVVANDLVNGVPATLGTTGNATVATVGTYPAGITLNTTTGSVSAAAGTTPGTYTLVYQLCDKLTPVTCTTSTATVTVTSSLSAAPDAGTAPATGGTVVPNVAANDKVNGLPATLGPNGNATVSTVGTVPPGLSLDPTTGSVSLANGTTPGTYTLVYQLCDKLTPVTCTTGLVSVTVSPVILATPDAGTASQGIAIANVTANDRVNGLPATLGATGNATVSTVGTYPAGITLSPTTGSVSVAVGTTPGTYTVVYQLCDKLTPVTCATTTAVVTVSAVTNTAPDSGTAPATGGIAILNVVANDVVNGVPATLGTNGNATVSTAGTVPTGITLDPNTGSLSVATGTAPGTYTLIYQLCDKLTPVTCTTGLATVTVAPSLSAAPDAGTVSSGTGGTAIANIATNDKINGLPATLGTTGNATVASVGTYPPGITLDSNTGSVSVAVGTTPGTYTVVYQLCDKLSPVTCTTSTATVTVTSSLSAAPDAGTAPATGGTVVPNVAANDLVNGQPATLGAGGNATVSTVGTVPPGLSLDPTTGSVSLANGTTPGTYTLVYQLCDKLTPVTCTTGLVSVTVSPVILATPDAGTASQGIAIANVTANDRVNGLLATLGATGNATVANVGTYPSGISLNTTTGSVSVAVGTTPGTYTLVYQLCDKLTPVTCATTTAVVTVSAVTNTAPDSGTAPATGGIAIPNVVANDVINGVPATLGTTGNATVSTLGTVPPGISLDPNTGSVSVAVGTTPGTYTLVYQLCDKLTPVTCMSSTATITVSASLSAAPDAGTATAGIAITNVAANDRVNGVPATLGATGNATVTTVGIVPPGITLDPNTGSLSVANGTTPSTYTIVYQLCDKLTPVTCTTGLATVTVAPSLSAAPDAGTVSSGTGGTAIANIATNDKVNGIPATLGTTGNATVASVGTYPAGITLDSNTGSVSVAVGTVPGTYTVVYQLCDKLSPVTCTTSTVTVTVTSSLSAAPDAGIAPATGGTVVPNVAANDKVNGLPATLGPNGNATVSTVGTVPPGLSLDPTTGSVSLANGTPPGTYTLVYQLCDKLTPVTCTTGLVSVTVSPVILATPDAGTASQGIAIANVTANDRVNGLPATLGTSGNATVTNVGTYPPGISLNPNTGSVSVAVGTTPGTYTLVYQLCDKLTPVTCATTTAVVTVSAVTNTAPDSGTAPATGGIAIPNVAANDVVNGVPATLGTGGNATVATVGTYLPGITLDPNTGSLSVATGTLPGTYTVVYQLCDKLTPVTCTTGLATVTVTPSLSAAPDAGTATTGIAITNVAANDKVNGQPATLGATGNATVSTVGTYPVGITLNPTTGSVSVTSGTAPGTYTLVYQLCDKLSPITCTTGLATVIVPGLPPVTTPDIANTNPGTPVSGNVLTNDTDPQGLLLTASLLTPPSAGTVTISPNGSYTYTPPVGFTGTVSFCYTASNTAGLSGSACVTVNVNPAPSAVANNAPIANNDNSQTTAGVSVTINVAANDTDPDSATTLNGQLNSPTLLGQPSAGTAIVNGTGTVTYTPPVGFTGVVSFPYQICDKSTPGLCTTAIVTVNVLPTPPANTTLAPVALDDALLVQFNKPAPGTVAANDSDPQGLPLTYTTGQPASGTVVMSPTGSYTYTPAPGYVGPTSFTYSVCNTAGKCDVATVSVLVQQAATTAVVLQLKVLLQGALIGGTGNLMRDDLRSKKFLPLLEPYSAIGGTRFTHVNGGGGETMPAAVTALNVGTGDAVVDWVFVELRSPSNLSLVVATRSALVQRDGDVVLASDGVSPLSFSGLSGSFYVSVKHRNHLGVMTATAIPLSTTGTVVDFTTATSSQVYSTTVGAFNFDGAEQITVGGKQALWAGDANHNGKVKYQGAANDLITIFSEVISAQSGNSNPLYNYDAALGYYFGDVNMDGKVKYQGTGTDTSLIFTNVITNYQTLNSAQLYNFDFMLEQIP